MGSWLENLTNVIRYTIFQDSVLKDLMLIPDADKNNMIAFRDKYFIRDVNSDTLIIDEKVRILYYESEPVDRDNYTTMNNRIYFDVYVNKTNAYNASNDRMMHRAYLICNRLNKLLSGKKVYNMNFKCRGIFDQTSRAEGFDRLTIVFAYKRIYK